MKLQFRGIILLLLTVCWWGAVAPNMAVAAAAAERQAYVTLQLNSQLWYNDTLQVALVADEAKCRKAYGNRWQQMCAVAPGQRGAIAEGFELSPKLEGEWRWISGNVARFVPKRAWGADVTYTVSVRKLTLPARVRLSKQSESFYMWALSALIEKGSFWIDPRPDGERAASFDVHFSTIPDKATIERDVVVSVNNGMRVGKTQFVWTDNDSRCLIKVPVTRLPSQPGTLRVDIPGVKMLTHAKNNNISYFKDKIATQALEVLPASKLFSIKGNLALDTSPQLNKEYVLTINSSLLVRPDALQKALKVVELPAMQQAEAVRAYRWDVAPSITPEDIQKGRALELVPLQAADVPSTVIRYRVPVQPGRYVFCQLDANFSPQGDAVATGGGRPWQGVYKASTGEPSINFLQPGNILRLNADARLDVVGTGLKNIKWRAETIQPAFWGRLAAMGDISSNDVESYDIDTMSVAAQGEVALPATKDKQQAQFTALDLRQLVKDARGLVRISLTGVAADVEKKDSTPREVTVSRILQLTPWGILAKEAADGAQDVFVCDLNSGNPVSNATVRVLGKNGIAVHETTTDAQGKAHVVPLRGLERERTPIAILVSGANDTSLSGDVAWLSLDDGARIQSYSRFAVGGMRSYADGINAYVFSQRGMFRPGETLHFGAIVRRGDWQALPADMPLTVCLYDPADTRLVSQPATLNAQGLLSFSHSIADTAPTGRYRAEVCSGNVTLGSCVVRVEEFQPDTMSLQVALPKQLGKGWLYVAPDKDTAAPKLEVTLRNLYGTPAADRRIESNMRATPAPLTFDGFEGYTFYDGVAQNKAKELSIPLDNAKTDAQGKATLSLPLTELAGTMQVSVLVEGFEAGGGRAVSQRRTFWASRLPRIMGYKPSGSGTNLNFVPQGQKTDIEFITLDPQLNAVNPGALTFTVAERRYINALVTTDSGRYAYEETPVDTVIHENTVTPSAEGTCLWAIPTQAAGDYLVSVRDSKGTLMARVPFVVAGDDDLRPTQASRMPSSTLRVRCDKSDYEQGATVQMMLSAPYDGLALVTLERDRVWQHQFVPVKAGNSVHSFALPAAFEGRGYINVSLVRHKDAPEIFMAPYATAVAPLTVNVAKRDFALRINAPKQSKPGENLVAKVTAQEKGSAIIFAVDEGVLQLTRFVTPKPLHYLLVDRALEVQTRHMLDLLMPEHALLAKRIPAFGGGMDMLGGRFHNPFKRRTEPPLAYWSAVVNVGPEGTDVTVPVPQWYSGSVRIMAVGASTSLAGNAEASSVIRGNLTLSPQLPLHVAPSDIFSGGVLVSNNTDASLPVELVCEAMDPLKLEGETTKKITIDANKETLVPLSFVAGNKPGATTVRFTARTPEGEVKREMGLSVRPASLWRQTMLAGQLKKENEAQAVSQELVFRQRRALLPQIASEGMDTEALGAETSFSIATVPLPALRALVRHLRTYPYGCTEQMLSRGLGAALLKANPAIAKAIDGPRAAKMQEEDAKIVAQALQAARVAMRYDGLMSWPDGSMGSGDSPEALAQRYLLNAYGADVLLAAQEAGFTLPGDALSSFINVINSACSRTPASLSVARAQAYGLWVLTRIGEITAPAIERLRPDFDALGAWKEDITGLFIAACYASMRMDSEAKDLVAQFKMANEGFVPQGPLNELAVQSLAVTILARHFPLVLNDLGDDLGQRMIESCNGNVPSTFSSALAVRALLQLSQSDDAATGSLQGVGLQCTAMHKGFAPVPEAQSTTMWDTNTKGMLTLNVPGCASAKLVNSLSVPLPTMYYEVSAAGYDAAPLQGTKQQGMEVTRTWKNSAGAVASKARQGEVLTVELTAKGYGDTAEDVVICDLLPGGCEFVLDPDAMSSDSRMRVERREDRILFFTRLNTNVQKAQYKVRVTQKGDFVLPAAQGEGMYNPAIFAHSREGRIIVE